jgi:hypothetical protein
MRLTAIVFVCSLVSGLAFVTACSIPEKQFSAPFGCDGATLPPTPETVTISGTVKDPVNGKLQAPSATVEVLQVPSLPFVLPFQTDGSGAFSLTHGTGMAPRDVYFHVTASGYKDTYFFPSLPLVGDVNVTILLFTPAAIGQLATALEQMGQPVAPDPAKALLIVSAVDCNADPVGGAKITTTSSEGTMVYLDTGVTPNVTANQTDPTTGSALVLNASPSSLTVNASLPDRMLRGHVITAFAGAVNQTEIQP